MKPAGKTTQKIKKYKHTHTKIFKKKKKIGNKKIRPAVLF